MYCMKNGRIFFDEPEIFLIVEEMPGFPGGEAQLVKFLSENIKYPAIARENGITGTVFVTFVIGPDGGVKDVKVLRGIGGGCRTRPHPRNAQEGWWHG